MFVVDNKADYNSLTECKKDAATDPCYYTENSTITPQHFIEQDWGSYVYTGPAYGTSFGTLNFDWDSGAQYLDLSALLYSYYKSTCTLTPTCKPTLNVKWCIL